MKQETFLACLMQQDGKQQGVIILLMLFWNRIGEAVVFITFMGFLFLFFLDTLPCCVTLGKSLALFMPSVRCQIIMPPMQEC